MKQISFRITSDEYDRFSSIVKDNLNISLAKFYKEIGNSILYKNADIKETLTKKNINIGKESDYTDKIVQVCLTEEQHNALIESSSLHGWSLSREMRFRIQTTLSNEMDFYDQELQEMALCRNEIKRIGQNINLILRYDDGKVLDKDGLSFDMKTLLAEIEELEKKFNHFIKKCNGRVISNRL